MSESTRKPYDNKKHFSGHYNPKPGELNAAWPTVRTETFVEMVFGVIKEKGQCTQREIVDATKLNKDQVGVALADLMLWRATVKSTERSDIGRIYFVNE